jgi:hypothetical protein
MGGDDPRCRAAEAARRLNEFEIAQHQPLATHDAGEGDPVYQQEGQVEIGLARPQHADDGDDEHIEGECGVDDGSADGAADLSHRLAHEERAAGVLHQMPAVSYLDGLRQGTRRRLSVVPATVTGNGMDQRLTKEPGFRCRRLPVGKQDDRPATFEVADNRAIAVIAPPREVIDTDYAQWLARRPCPLPDHAQQRIVADR